MRARVILVACSTLRLASGAFLELENPTRQSSFHAGDRVAVRWFYQGTGEFFSIWLHKDGQRISDLCEAERDGLCYDLTEDQTVILPSTGMASGSDYTITVADASSDASATSEPFTIIGDPYSSLQITQPDGSASFSPGDEVEVKWYYVGENSLFDIYVRQGDGYDSRRVSENLCQLEEGGSCRSSTIGRAVVTLPRELEESYDYALLVVDRDDDDAHGMSSPISIEGSTSRTASSSSGLFKGLSEPAEIVVLTSICVAGLCICMVLAACAHRRRQKRIKISEEKITQPDSSKPQRPAPTVTLSIEDMQRPVSPAESEDVSKNFINPIYSTTSLNFYEGQITPPTDDSDSIVWRKSRDMGRYVGRHISKSLSRSLTNIED